MAVGLPLGLGEDAGRAARNMMASGVGTFAAFVDALDSISLKNFHITDFRQHAITKGSTAEAAAYVEVERTRDQKRFWGASIESNIEFAGIKALVSSFNRANALATKGNPITPTSEVSHKS